MEYKKPYCYRCPLFKSAPTTIGGSAKCSAYTRGIPKAIFFEGKTCTRKNDKIYKNKAKSPVRRKKVASRGKR